MSNFFNYKLSALPEYVPGEQPQNDKYIKLNTNESPFPPSPAALAELKRYDAGRLKLYSDIKATALVDAICEVYSVDEDNVLATNGSDEALAFIFNAFGSDRQGFAFPDVTYGFYPVFCKLYGVAYTEVPLKDDFSVDVDGLINQDGSIIIANPNANVGRFLELSEVERMVKSKPSRLVVVDEAYVDFGGESAVELTKKYDNIIVVQTFSKSRNLAGARIGFAIACKRLIDDIKRIKFAFHPYNVNSLSNLIGAAAMRDVEYLKYTTDEIKRNRAYFVGELERLGFSVIDSRANFVMCYHPRICGKTLYEKLKLAGVLVRRFDIPRILDYIRVTVGSKEQMVATVEQLNRIIKEYDL